MELLGQTLLALQKGERAWTYRVITSPERLRQEHHCDFECSLGYTVNSLLAWPAMKSCLKRINKKEGDKNQNQGRRKRKKKGKDGKEGKDGRDGRESE